MPCLWGHVCAILLSAYGGEIGKVNQTFEEILRGNLFVLLPDRASLPHFRVFAMPVRHPCGNCLSDKRMETAGKMTEHFRLQGKVCFTRPKPMVLKELVHEFQIRGPTSPAACA